MKGRLMRYFLIFLSWFLLISPGLYPAGANDLDDEEVFALVIETTSAQTEFKFVVDGAEDLGIHWGDGHSEFYNGDVEPSHDYGEAGEWIIQIEGRAERIAFFTGLEVFHGHMLQDILTPVSDGVSGITSARKMFYITKVEAFSAENFFDDVSAQVTDMHKMFAGSDFNQDISNWDVSQATDMGYMFSTTPFDQDIGGWDVGQVTNMQRMFSHGNFNRDIGSWDVGNVTNMEGMFSGDMFYRNPFNQDIGGWDVSQVTNMGSMFWNTEFNQDIGGWDVGNVSNMETMFSKSDFNQDIGEWDVSMVTNMRGMFRESPFNQDISDWDVSNVNDMSTMFWDTQFNQFIGEWDVGNVNNMSGMFRSAEEFNQDIGEWDVSMVTDMSWMFHTSAFNHDIGNWDVSNVTDMRHMFLSSDFNQDIGGLDVSQVEDMSFMFRWSAFNQDIGGWDVSKVRNMEYMLNGTDFDQDISQWDVSKVESFAVFLAFSKLSTEHYNSLLIAWSYLDLQHDVEFHGGDSNYDPGEPEERRQYIIDTFGWQITDGGLAAEMFYLTLLADPEEGGSVHGEGDYEEGEAVDVVATPGENWLFVRWADADGVEVSDQASFTYTMPANDVSLTAIFEQDDVDIAETEAGRFVVYPNPASNHVVLESDHPIYRLSLADLSGRIVLTMDIDAMRTEIPVGDLYPGVYLLRAETAKGEVIRRLHVVR